MKVFEFKNDYNNYRYPEDVKQIVDYLSDRGTINVSTKTLVGLYEDYCDEVWSAGWMILSDDLLYSFAEWLSEREI